MNNPVLVGEILALAAAASGSVGSIIISNLGHKADSSLIGYVRMFIAAPLMIILALCVDGTQLFNAPLTSLVWIIVSGILGFFVTDIFLFRAYAVFGAQETMVVMCFTPVLSTVFSFILFSEIPTSNELVGIILTVAGIIITLLKDIKGGHGIFSFGCICALLAALLQSFSDMTAKGVLENLPFISSAALRAVSGLIAWIIFGFFKSKTLFKDIDTVIKPSFMFFLSISVVISTALGTICAIGALKFAPGGVVSSLKQVSPVLILPYDFLVLKKRSVLSVIGTVVAVAGVILIFS